MTTSAAQGAIATMEQEGVGTREKKLSAKEESATAEKAEKKKLQGTMLMRSTGLGKAELVAEITDIKRQGDYLIMELQTLQPVRWKIRGGLSHQDLRLLLRAMAKLSVLAFFFNLRAWFRPPKHPGDF
jgi:hypothetical protein